MCTGKNKAISKSMARKICYGGLTYDHLKLAFERDEETGVRALLTERNGNKARVTNRGAIINSITSHFQEIGVDTTTD